MGFTITAEEFEETQETKNHAIRFEVMEAQQKLDMLEDRYRERRKAIERRKKNLWAAFWSRIVVILFLQVFSWILQKYSLWMFAMSAVGVISIMTICLFLDTVRVLGSICVHNEYITGIFNETVYKIARRRRHSNSRHYTLKQEEETIVYLTGQVQENKKRLQMFLQKEEVTEEEGRTLLASMATQLEEQ